MGPQRQDRRPALALALTLTAFLTGLIVSLAASGAAAVDSTWSYYGPVSGTSYKNRASIVNTSSGLKTTSTVTATAGGPIKSGYAGAQARMFRYENDALLGQGTFTYNSGPVSTMSSSKTWDFGKVTAYSWGVTKAYVAATGEYNAYYTFKSDPVIGN